MFSPVYFEKLDTYIERLDHVAELAYQHAQEIGLDTSSRENVAPVCTKCFKRKKLDFGEPLSSIQKRSLADLKEAGICQITDSEIRNADTSLLLPCSSFYDVTRTSSPKRGKFLPQKVKNNDSTFVSAMLKTLVTLNSSTESLSRGVSFREPNETGSRKKGSLRRRHTTILDENAFMLSESSKAAVTACGDIDAKASRVSKSNGNDKAKVALRSSQLRKRRPLSYPNRKMQRVVTSPNLGRDSMSSVSAKTGSAEQTSSLAWNCERDNENEDNDNRPSETVASHRAANDRLPSGRTVEASANTEDAAHHMYYSLSPAMLDSPLRLEDLRRRQETSQKDSGNSKIGEQSEGLTLGDLDDSIGNAHRRNLLYKESHLSPNPEYFSVISKSRKKHQGGSARSAKGKSPLDVNIVDKRALTATDSKHTFEHNGLGQESHCLALADDGIICDSDVIMGNVSMADSTADNGVEGSSSYRHGDGLLYTSSFGLGSDQAWHSSFAESDLTKDGYCKCNFCNHDVILTPLKSDFSEVPLNSNVFENDFAKVHEELQRLRSFSATDDSMTSLQRAQGDQFPPPRLSKESVAPQLDLSIDVACSAEEDRVPDINAPPIVCSFQKALQQDIEKHRSGVASVLNLCEVLLHDGDACANEDEKESLQRATNSLDRRWRNICSLSMERKLNIEDTQRFWKKFLEDHSRFNDWLRSAEHVVRHPHTFMVSYKVARDELKRYESFQRQVHESLTQLELLNKQYRKLARENRTDATNKLRRLIHEVNSRWDALSHRASSILRRLKHAISRREDFETRRESLLVWLTETDLRLTNVEHFMRSENYDKLKEVRNFQTTVEEHVPQILEVHRKGRHLLEKCEEFDCATVEEELAELHRYCRDVVARLDRYHKRLLRIMNEPPPLDSSLFEDTELAQMNWWENYISETNSSRNSSPVYQSQSEHGRHISTPRSQTSTGRATPESLEWDLYDISQSELETKNTGILTDDDSIPEISPLETASDDIPLLHLSRDSNPATTGQESLNLSRRSRDAATSSDGLSSAKKLRTSLDETSQQKMQFMNDLIATLAWVDATEKVTDQEMKKSKLKHDKSILELDLGVKELRDLQKSMEQRKAVLLSINLVSSSFTDSEEISEKLERMNSGWESLQQKAVEWNTSLQESLLHSQEFQSTMDELATWVDQQNRRRDDVSMTQQRETAESSPLSKMQLLKTDHKILDQMRTDALEAISKVTSMQDICIQLTMPGSGKRNRVGGMRRLSENIRSTNGRLKVLLDAVRSDLRDMEHRIKSMRRKIRQERSSDSDVESSGESSLRSSTPIRLRMLQRKVEASELHSSGKNQSKDDNMTKAASSDDAGAMQHSLVAQESYSSIDDVTLNSLHAKPKKTASKVTKASSIAKGGAIKKTVSSCETRGVAVLMYGKGTKAKPVAAAIFKKKSGLCCRVCVAALLFYFFVLMIVLLPWLLQAVTDDGLGCLRQNNYAYSLTPMLTYTNGPPPM